MSVSGTDFGSLSGKHERPPDEIALAGLPRTQKSAKNTLSLITLAPPSFLTFAACIGILQEPG